MDQTEWLIKIFRFLCLLTAISLCTYWFYKFQLNEGTSVVNFKKFSPESRVDNIPTISLCFDNPFLNDSLAEYGTDQDDYLSFLEGKSFNEKMLKIDYNSVTLNITSYIKEYEILFKNGSSMKTGQAMMQQEIDIYTSNSFNGFIFGTHTGFYKCFSFEIPNMKDLMIFRMLVSNKIFKDGLRPVRYKLRAYLHLPQQFLMPGYDTKWTWDYMSRKSIYKTRFIVRTYELDRKRATSKIVCNENWNNYDKWVMKQFENEVGCRSPYNFNDGSQKLCKSQDEILRSYFYRGIVADGKYPKPCSTMESMRMEFMESNLGDTNEQYGHFWFGIYFYLDSYKEIVHIR